MYSKKELQPLFLFGAAAVGFAGGVAKELVQAKKAGDVAQGIAAVGIATKTVQETTRPFSYFGHEDSRAWNAMAQVSRGGGIFAKTAAATVAGSLAGEYVGAHIRSANNSK